MLYGPHMVSAVTCKRRSLSAGGKTGVASKMEVYCIYTCGFSVRNKF